MKNELEIFKSEEFGEVRTTVVNEKPYICLADICKILDLEQVSRVKSRLNQDGVTTSKVIDSLGREQEATFINESNLYKVIFQSRKPEAEKFTEWVTSEVLPSIRKTGGYVSNEELFISTYLPFADENTKMLFGNTLKTIREQNATITELQPKADYFDALVERNLLTNLRDTAKELKIAPGVFNKYLLENGYLYRNSQGKLKPYQAKMKKGLFELKEFKNKNGYVDNQTMVTPKGRETLRLLLRKDTSIEEKEE